MWSGVEPQRPNTTQHGSEKEESRATEVLETFEAPGARLSEIKFATSVDVSCPYRDGRDEYEVTIGYSPQGLCATGGSLEGLIEGYNHAIISKNSP